MFSQLGPLFKTTFARQAEANDTRQSIPHEERDERRRRREEEDRKETESDFWEDNTSVSVDALRAFLINFIKTMPGMEDAPLPEQPKGDKDLPARPPEAKRPTSTHNAKAVRAYQSMAAQSQNETIKPPKTDDKIAAPTADLLESKELRDIYALIDDLDNLSQAGTQELQIQKADSFLESLKNAVYLKKSKI